MTDRSVEEIRHLLVDVRDESEESHWKAGALLCELFAASAREAPKHMTRQDLRHRRAELLQGIAGLWGDSPSRIVQLAQVYAALGEVRDRTHVWTWHRAVHLAAKRTGKQPLTMLDEAVADGLTVPELNRLGAKPKPGHGAALSSRCAGCGSRVQYVCEGEVGTKLRGTAVPCGACIGLARREGKPDSEVGVLGVME
jgi:hypothetical protein